MGKIAFIYPGQGSQAVGMAAFIEDDVQLKNQLTTLENQIGVNLLELMNNGPIEALTKAEYAQPALVYVSSILTEALKKAGIVPDYVAGHSLGEYSAFVASGVINLSEGVHLVHQRGQCMSQKQGDHSGGMAAVMGIELASLKEAMNQINQKYSEPVLFLANINAPGQIVISGAKEAIEAHTDELKAAGAKRVIPLQVSGAFHSAYMEDAAASFAKVVEEVQLNHPEVPIVLNCNASICDDASILKENMVRQMTESVLWTDSVQAMIEQGVDTFVEIGPGKVLTGLLKKIDRNLTSYQVANLADVAALKTTLGGN